MLRLHPEISAFKITTIKPKSGWMSDENLHPKNILSLLESKTCINCLKSRRLASTYETVRNSGACYNLVIVEINSKFNPE
jgi:hypothetical protein